MKFIEEVERMSKFKLRLENIIDKNFETDMLSITNIIMENEELILEYDDEIILEVRNKNDIYDSYEIEPEIIFKIKNENAIYALWYDEELNFLNLTVFTSENNIIDNKTKENIKEIEI